MVYCNWLIQRQSPADIFELDKDAGWIKNNESLLNRRRTSYIVRLQQIL